MSKIKLEYLSRCLPRVARSVSRRQSVKDPRSRFVTLFSPNHVSYNSLREGDRVDKGSAVSLGQSRKEISSFNDTGCSPDKRYAKDDK